MLLRETILYLPAQLAEPLAQFLSVILRTYFLARRKEMGASARPACCRTRPFFRGRYPGRLNVSPVSPDWRCPLPRETDEAMRQRVDHDLYCIDIRSLGFDLYILLLTVISPKAGRNAR